MTPEPRPHRRADRLFPTLSARHFCPASLPCAAATEIGIGLTSFGCLFTLLGVMLFFDRGLLSMGNILFLSGVTTTIGPRRT